MARRSWVALPLAPDRTWAVPRECIGEILTLPGESAELPGHIQWRGTRIPVVDPAGAAEPSRPAGLLAVILGLRERPGGHWAVALRGDGLAIHDICADAMEDETVAIEEGAAGAFRMRGALYQVPDLPALQCRADTGGSDPAQQGAPSVSALME